jgi:hypothetical protein
MGILNPAEDRCCVDGELCEHYSFHGLKLEARCKRYRKLLRRNGAGWPLRCNDCKHDHVPSHRPLSKTPTARKAKAEVSAQVQVEREETRNRKMRELEAKLSVAQTKLAKEQAEGAALVAKIGRWKRFFEGAMTAKRENDQLARALNLIAHGMIVTEGNTGARIVTAAMRLAKEQFRLEREAWLTKQAEDGKLRKADRPRDAGEEEEIDAEEEGGGAPA